MTHCKHGHAYVGNNVLPFGEKRQCRRCRDDRNARRITDDYGRYVGLRPA